VLTIVNKSSASRLKDEVDRTDRSPERARQDYVKAIYQLGGDLPVSGADLARYLAVSRTAVTKSRRILVKERLVKPASSRTDLIELTALGRRLAARMLRRHRLIETFLHRSLKMPLDGLHRQAEAIEHVISDDVAARLARFLGNPTLDPHGHPISTKSRGLIPHKSISLADAKPGSRLRIESIPDRDPSVVRQLSLHGILPGLKAQVSGRRGGCIVLRSVRATHTVPSAASRLIRVCLTK
jgi:DtxR family transcriptional regulator, Mn-dependent transcriptional regulator